jgi:hypothetical protein
MLSAFFQNWLLHKRVMNELVFITEILEKIPDFFYYQRTLRFQVNYLTEPDKEDIYLEFISLFPPFKLPINTIRIIPCYQGFRYEIWRGFTKWEWKKNNIEHFLLKDLLREMVRWQKLRLELIQNRFHPRNIPHFIHWGFE